MKRASLLFLYLLLAATLPSAFEMHGQKKPANLLEAREFCDKADLQPLEGLWSFPTDDVTVLIYRSDERKGLFDITVIEAADCSLKPGMKIGELSASADPDKFNLKLYSSIKKGILGSPLTATAVYSENKESLTVKKISFQFRINPTRLLPSFWRMASVSIRQREPAPEGMIKVYPSYDGNGSTRRGPRYL